MYECLMNAGTGARKQLGACQHDLTPAAAGLETRGRCGWVSRWAAADAALGPGLHGHARLAGTHTRPHTPHRPHNTVPMHQHRICIAALHTPSTAYPSTHGILTRYRRRATSTAGGTARLAAARQLAGALPGGMGGGSRRLAPVPAALRRRRRRLQALGRAPGLDRSCLAGQAQPRRGGVLCGGQPTPAACGGDWIVRRPPAAVGPEGWATAAAECRGGAVGHGGEMR